jgi:hypothetical protein
MFTIIPDEFLGLNALIEPDGADDGGDTDSAVVSKARALMRGALADKLQEVGLPWAPSAEAVKKRAAEAAEPPSGMRALMGNKKVRKYGTSVVAVAALVALWGGYRLGWSWTGFQANNQLWDWLSLLLLPVALGTIPLWIQDRDYISRPRRVAYGVVIVAWTGLMIAGYLIPLNWTGFPGTTLSDWLGLILVPVALTSTMALTRSRVRSSKTRSLRPYQKGLIAALAVGWIVTVIGGYLLRWSWTGYAGMGLWEWLKLLLEPLVFSTILLPALLKWVSGNAARRASEARKAPVIQMLQGLKQASLFLWVPKTCPSWADGADRGWLGPAFGCRAGRSWSARRWDDLRPVGLKLIFLIVSRAVSVLGLSRREPWWKDAEILMLRHQ